MSMALSNMVENFLLHLQITPPLEDIFHSADIIN